MLRSSGLGGAGSSAPWISCAARVRRRQLKNLLNHHQLSLWSSGSAQMFKYREAIFVRPVVQDFGNEEDRDILLQCRLRRKEVVRLGTQILVVPTQKWWR